MDVKIPQRTLWTSVRGSNTICENSQEIKTKNRLNRGGAGTFGSDTITFGGWVSDGNFKLKQKVPGYFWTPLIVDKS